MAHQLIVTSAKQGLDGISGYQSVLQSKGLLPQVANRLQKAAGYSHPFPHGDPRNPVVYLHRIEEAAGKTWHVLGCVRDAGSDHTGRSNFLAHVLAAAQTEVRGKKGGPAAVMAAAGLFRDSWAGPPDPAAPEKTLVSGEEKPQPGGCSAWTAAGLDPGLAGDLAEHATNKKPVVLVTRPGDDVLALFRDALRLVQPDKRWSVTFNTCAIQPFDGIWKGIRADLPQARDARASQAAVVIDLTASPRGSDSGYAQYARGEAETLPWQGASKPSRTVAPAEEPVGPSVGGTGGLPKPVPGPSGTAGTAGTAGTETRPWGRGLGDGTDSQPGPIIPRIEEGSRWPGWLGPVLGAAAAVLFVVVLAGIVLRDEIVDFIRPDPAKPPVSSDQVKDSSTETPSGPTEADLAQMAARRRQREIDEARKALEAAAGDRTRDAIREEARQLIAEIDQLRAGVPPEGGLEIRESSGVEYKQKLNEAIAAADRADEALRRPDDAADLVADLQAATIGLKEAVGLLDLAKKRVPELAADERKARAGKMQAEQAAAAAAKQKLAFTRFQQLDELAELPASGTNRAVLPGGGSVSAALTELGSVPVADLIDPTFSLAAPDETINGAAFDPRIEKVDEGRWEIQYDEPRKPSLGGPPPKPLALATLSSSGELLNLKVAPLMLDTAGAILRRCVILAEAKDPETKQPLVKAIRLVKPTKVGPLKLDPTAGRRAIRIPVPPGINRRDVPPGGSSVNLAFPVSGLEVKGRFGGQEKTIRFPEDAAAGSPGIWSGTIDVKQLPDGMTLTMKVELSLPEATLACTPGLANPGGGRGVDLAGLAEFGQKKGKSLDEFKAEVKKDFDKRVKDCPGRKYKTAHGTKGQADLVSGWFQKGLAPSPRMPLRVPGHATIAQSIDLFLTQRYNDEDARLQRDYDHQFARAKEEDKAKIKREKPKTPQFFNGFKGWSDACETADEAKWPQYFEAPLDAWAPWFWAKFEDEWNRQAVIAEAVRGQFMEAQLLEITSVARDADGKEHRVALVTFDPTATPEAVGPPGGGPPEPAAETRKPVKPIAPGLK